MMIVLFVFVLGAIVGSFLNVCIYRIPRGQSLVFPSSSCTKCNVGIRFFDNIPIFSYFVLGGKCRNCGSSFTIRYPLVETVSAIFFVLLFFRFGLGANFIVHSLLISSLLVVSFIDLEFQIIPDRITLPGIVIGILCGGFFIDDPFMSYEKLGLPAALIGAVSGFLFYYLVAMLSLALFKKEGLGGGDIKLMTMIGSFVGWKGVVLTTFIGSLVGSVLGVLIILIRGREKGTVLPFGPYLAIGSVITIFFGENILEWYLN